MKDPRTPPMDSLRQLVSHAQSRFPEAFAKLPAPKLFTYVGFQCECCHLSFQGLHIGQAFNGGRFGPAADAQEVVKMVATVKADSGEVRVFLLQDDALFDHSSYSVREADEFCGNYRYPFHLLAPKLQTAWLEALIRAYLSVFGYDNALKGIDDQFKYDFEATCRAIQAHSMRANSGAVSRPVRMLSETKTYEKVAEAFLKSEYRVSGPDHTMLIILRTSRQAASKFGAPISSTELAN